MRKKTTLCRCGSIFVSAIEIFEYCWKSYECPRCTDDCHVCAECGAEFEDPNGNRPMGSDGLIYCSTKCADANSTPEQQIEALKAINREMCLPEILPLVDAPIAELKRGQKQSWNDSRAKVA